MTRLPRSMAAQWLLAAGLLGAIAWALLTLGHLDPAALEGQLRATGGWAPLVFVLLYTAEGPNRHGHNRDRCQAHATPVWPRSRVRTSIRPDQRLPP